MALIKAEGGIQGKFKESKGFEVTVSIFTG
jgi:hypothetical protein